jgi:ribosome maturation factor RimP
MSESELKGIVARLAAPLAASLGLELWGVEAALSGKGVLRVFADAPGGADIDRCAELSRLLGLALDVEDCMTGPYVLEVSSPGLERRFFTAEQLAGAVGSQVEIVLLAPLTPGESQKKFQGELTVAEGDCFTLAPDCPRGQGEAPSQPVFSFAQLKTARLRPLVAEKTRPGKSGTGKKAARRTGAGGHPAPRLEE